MRVYLLSITEKGGSAGLVDCTTGSERVGANCIDFLPSTPSTSYAGSPAVFSRFKFIVGKKKKADHLGSIKC